MKLGSLDVMKEAIVADIEDEALLGYDVLCDQGKGAADILLSENLIIIDGIEFPCFQVGKDVGPRRVKVAKSVEVPGRFEMLIDVY